MRTMKKQLKYALIVVLAIFIVFFWVWNIREDVQENSNIIISEVCPKNLSVVGNEEGEYPSGWIELFNAGEESCDLNGWKLSLGKGFKSSVELQGIKIEPQDYILIYADENMDNTVDEEGHIYLKADLYGKNGNVYLYNSQGKEMDSVNVPELPVNTSYVWMEEKDGFEVRTCTPYAPNFYSNLVEVATISAPDFSKESGFYEEDFWLTIDGGNGREVYYTLDGSIPTKESFKYSEPLLMQNASLNDNRWCIRTDLTGNEYEISEELVDKANIVRAVAYDADGNKSEVVTKTFFVGKELREKYGAEIATISLVATPEALFGYEDGILVLGKTYDEWLEYLGYKPANKKDYQIQANFNGRGRKWERQADISFFDGGQFAFSKEIGISGRGVASSDSRQKGLTLRGRDMYDGNAVFAYDIFGNGRLNRKLILKNCNSIWRDGFISNLFKERDVAIQQYRPVNVFLNGEYWGLYNLLERYDEQYFVDYYGVDKEDVVVAKNGEYMTAKDAQDEYSIENLIRYAETHDMSIEENYEKMCEWIDIDSFIHYYCVQIYIDVYDSTETYNMMAWKTRKKNKNNPYADGRWRWVNYDIDSSLRDYKFDNMTQKPKEGNEAYFERTMMKALLKNDTFKKKFIEYFYDLMGYEFRADYVVPEFLENAYQIKDAMEWQRQRFPEVSYRSVEEEIEMITEFYMKRKNYVEIYLENALR